MKQVKLIIELDEDKYNYIQKQGTVPILYDNTIAIAVLNGKLLQTEPENQKTGHWEYVQYDSNPKIGNYHCSVCRHIIIPFENQKYCPNCGAKMEGE